MPGNQNIVVICGPTASGKTGLALQLAKELGTVNILSVDSRQVYKNLDIITGKDIPQDIPETIKVFGLDIFNSDDRANLADFVRYSQKVILDSKKTKTPLIIVGGTGLYLKAITQNLSDVTIPPNPKLREKIENLSVKVLQGLLNRADPKKYLSLNHSDLMNPRRLIRYLEISKSKTKPVNSGTIFSDIVFHWVGLLPDKATLKSSIRKRVLKRLQDGAIDEVKKLLISYPNKKLPIYTSLGVFQILNYLEGNISLEELINVWTNAELDYARRQSVWFKKQPDIVWYDRSIDKPLLIEELQKIYT
jgi:tRNA dimethylallyltransferase